MLKTIASITLILVMGINFAKAQCNGFAKKKCIPTLTPFISNGQLNSTSLTHGESAELVMNFYSDQSYRLSVCAQEILGDINYVVLDANQNEVFNSGKAKTKIFDFNTKSTQQLTIRVSAPSVSYKSEIVEEGCVSVLVGFKK